MYYLTKRIENRDFAETVARVRDALAEQEFGVLTEIDVQATLREKLGEETDPYLILGACNPTLAHRVIEAEPQIGVLLPCNVVVRAQGDAVVIDAMDPESVMSMVESPGVAEVADEVRSRLSTALGAV